MEQDRVASLGLDRSAVVWASAEDAGGDHDIRSLDEDGLPIWIEVKSTAGDDGRFEWSKAELECAIREGERYVLCRVYDAASRTPIVKRVPRSAESLVAGQTMASDEVGACGTRAPVGRR